MHWTELDTSYYYLPATRQMRHWLELCYQSGERDIAIICDTRWDKEIIQLAQQVKLPAHVLREFAAVRCLCAAELQKSH